MPEQFSSVAIHSADPTMAMVLAESIASLPLKQLQIVILRLMKDLTVEDVASTLVHFRGKQMIFSTTFLNQTTGDFVIYGLNNEGPPIPIPEYSINIALRQTTAVYSKMGGLQNLQWKYHGYLAALQTGQGFHDNYAMKALMSAKPYPKIPVLVAMANSTFNALHA